MNIQKVEVDLAVAQIFKTSAICPVPIPKMKCGITIAVMVHHQVEAALIIGDAAIAKVVGIDLKPTSKVDDAEPVGDVGE